MPTNALGSLRIRIAPATAGRWKQLGHVFGPREKDPTSCWCQRFRVHHEPDNRTALAREIAAVSTPIGLLAYPDNDDFPAGWTRVVPRSTLPGVQANRAIAAVVGDTPDAWWVSCVIVRREYRGRGIGAQLLGAAADFSAGQGAALLDGHPVDTALLKAPPAPSAVFTGTVSQFRRAGFVEIGRTFRSRPVMRRTFG